MAKRLLLVRHGRIAAGHAGRLIGASDVPLDSCGQRQAHELAATLERFGPQRCYCSPLTRCRQTAAAAVPQMEPTIDDDLREIDFGRWENHTFAEMAAADASLVERWATLADDFAFPGGDSVAAFLTRIRRAADRLTREDTDTVLAVAHGGVIRSMICYLLGLEPRHYVLFEVDYASLVMLRLFDGRGVLAGIYASPLSEPWTPSALQQAARLLDGEGRTHG
jgi:alpha-ribazole phosphatase